MSAEPDKPHVLIIDDDERLRDLIGRFLADHGFRVTSAAAAQEARDRLEGIIFDILVVDIMMPEESGLDFVRQLKQGSANNPPCLMLTAMGEPGHRLHGLESGADDYMTKPFEPLELVLRIKNLLARRPSPSPNMPFTSPQGSPQGGTPDGDSIRFGPHLFDLARQQLTTAGQRQHLTSAEKTLLACFCANPGQTLSREQLSDMLGGQMEGRSIDVAVARLRRKIEPNSSKPIYLLTARGQGWSLESDPPIKTTS